MKPLGLWLLFALSVGAIFIPPAAAEVIGEGVDTVRCTESADIELPRKLELLQSVLTGHFSRLGFVGLVVNAEYEEREVSRGKAIVSAVQVKPDGTEIALGKLVAKMKGSETEKVKMVEAVIEPGDQVRWRIKLKGMPKLEAELDECWFLSVAVFVADELPG